MADDASLENRLQELAARLAAMLQTKNLKCVFAESCTGGKMAAAITGVPGISGYFCGSAVTYREATKISWLTVSENVLSEHSAESIETTQAMAAGVLEKTSEANISIAITGHLGPGVDANVDGKIFVATAHRVAGSRDIVLGNPNEHRLSGSNRRQRQTEAACLAFEDFLLAIAQTTSNLE